jgi:3-phytase
VSRLLLVCLAAAVLCAPAFADRIGGGEVKATVETDPLFDDDAGGNADGDDPSIWVHPRDGARSLVIATKKDAGLDVYDLRGRTLQSIAPPPTPGEDHAPGRFNNVDLLYDVDGRDLAVVTDRGHDTLRVYAIDDRRLSDATSPSVSFVFSRDQDEVDEQATAYGLATWKAPNGRGYAFVTQRHATQLAMARLAPARGRLVDYDVVDRITLPDTFRLPNGTSWAPCEDPGEGPQLEGEVVDARRGVLYAAQEDVGVWRIPVSTRGFGRPELIERVREFGVPATFDPAEEECVPGPDPGFGGDHLSADAEGLTIYYTRTGDDYLLTSSQGDSTFSVFEAAARARWLGAFAVVDGRATDGVQHSDGAAVTNVPLGRFDHGLFVTHDGENTPDEGRTSTNFKLVPWEDVAAAVPRPLGVDEHGWDPRRQR